MITNVTSKLFRLSNFKKSILLGTHSFYPFVGHLSFINFILTENHSVLSHASPSAAITPGDRHSHVDRPNDSIPLSPQLSSTGPQTFLILHTAFSHVPSFPESPLPPSFPFTGGLASNVRRKWCQLPARHATHTAVPPLIFISPPPSHCRRQSSSRLRESCQYAQHRIPSRLLKDFAPSIMSVSDIVFTLSISTLLSPAQGSALLRRIHLS